MEATIIIILFCTIWVMLYLLAQFGKISFHLFQKPKVQKKTPKKSTETEIADNAIEEVFCKAMELCEKSQMSEDLARIYLQMYMAYQSKDPLHPEMLQQIQEMFPYKVITSRLKMYTYELDEYTKIFIFMLTEGNLGSITMYLTYLQYLSKVHKTNEIDFEFFGRYGFPWGFPNETELERLWKLQKIKASPDNLLDHSKALKSLLWKS